LLIRPASVKWATAKIFCALLTIYKSRTPQTRIGRTPPLASVQTTKAFDACTEGVVPKEGLENSCGLHRGIFNKTPVLPH
jgi:hypothetical protein